MSAQETDRVWEGQKKLMGKAFLAALTAGVGVGGIKALYQHFTDMSSDLDKPQSLGEKYQIAAPSQDFKPVAKPSSGEKYSAEKSDLVDKDVLRESPYAIPLLLGSLVGGGYLGYSLADYAPNKVRDYSLQSQEDELRKEQEQLLMDRLKLMKQSSHTPEAIDEAYAKYINKDNTKQAGWGDLALGGGLTAGALLWMMAHSFTKGKIQEANNELTGWNKIKERLPYEDIATPGTGLVLSKKDIPSLEEEDEKVIKESSNLEILLNNVDGVSPQNFEGIANSISTASRAAAASSDTGKAMVAPIIKNKDSAVEGISEGVQGKLKEYVPSFLQK